MKKIVIVGAGGLGREAAWVVERINALTPCFEILGFSDDAPDKQSGSCGGYSLLGKLETVAKQGENICFFCAIGDNQIRQRVIAEGCELGLELVALIDPSAVVAPGVKIGAGCYIGINTVVSTGTSLGVGVLVNHKVCVGHDVEVGDFAQLCPGVCVSGGCSIGEGALLGTLTGTIPLKNVGAWAVVGAGCVAMRDVEDGATVVRLGR